MPYEAIFMSSYGDLIFSCVLICREDDEMAGVKLVFRASTGAVGNDVSHVRSRCLYFVCRV